MKTKEEKISEFLSQLPKKGEKVTVTDPISGKKTTETVLEVKKNGDILIDGSYKESFPISKNDYERITIHIGYNPMVILPWYSSLTSLSYNLGSILHNCGYKRVDGVGIIEPENFEGIEIPEIEWNPYFIKDGEEIPYQRDFVWSQSDKELLIDSIYNSIDIGKIILRNRPMGWVADRAREGKKVAFRDVVDGKQRLSTILDFVTDKFPDSEGRYFKDFSHLGKLKFLNFSSLSYGELGENTTDEDTKAVFLGVNFAGVPMSQEQVDYVKSIKL